MAENCKIKYRIYLDGEDVNTSRIITTEKFVKNLFENCNSEYFHDIQIDNESDYDEYVLRLYIEKDIDEDCKSDEAARTFTVDMAEFLDKIAMVHNYIDMEGSFSIDYMDIHDSYKFTSESGQDFCDFIEQVGGNN